MEASACGDKSFCWRYNSQDYWWHLVSFSPSFFCRFAFSLFLFVVLVPYHSVRSFFCSLALVSSSTLTFTCICSSVHTIHLSLSWISLFALCFILFYFSLPFVFLSLFDTHSPVHLLLLPHFTNQTKVKAFIANRAVSHRVISFATRDPNKMPQQHRRYFNRVSAQGRRHVGDKSQNVSS